MSPPRATPDDPLDPVFRALASPVRRRLLDLLKGGPLTVGDLAAAFPELSRYAIMQHLRVLQRARLTLAEREGRAVMNYLNAAPLREVYERWVGTFEGPWAEALVGLKRSLELSEEDRAASRARLAVRRGARAERAPGVRGKDGGRA